MSAYVYEEFGWEKWPNRRLTIECSDYSTQSLHLILHLVVFQSKYWNNCQLVFPFTGIFHIFFSVSPWCVSALQKWEPRRQFVICLVCLFIFVREESSVSHFIYFSHQRQTKKAMKINTPNGIVFAKKKEPVMKEKK